MAVDLVALMLRTARFSGRLQQLRRCTTEARAIEKLIARNPTNKDKFGTPFAVRSKAILPLRIVETQLVKSVLPIIGNVAYVSIASGFLMTDFLALRAMLVVGYSGLVGYHLLHRAPLRIPLLWSGVFAAVNAAYAAQLYAERWPSGLTEDDLELHQQHFDRLSRREFKELLELAERRTLPDGAVLTREREQGKPLYFVERGQAYISYEGDHVASIGRGGFVNDVAFQQGPSAGAYGTVVCRGEVSVLEWDQGALREALASDTSLRDKVEHVLVRTLVEQLLQRYKAGEASHTGKGGGERLISRSSSAHPARPAPSTTPAQPWLHIHHAASPHLHSLRVPRQPRAGARQDQTEGVLTGAGRQWYKTRLNARLLHCIPICYDTIYSREV